eukprot:2629412-Ditylum_brightwellii.AAC.1
MAKTRQDKAATTTCSVATIKNTCQSTSSGLIKKETKHQRRRQKLRVLTEMAMGMTVTATSMMVTGMEVTAHIPHLVLKVTN